MITVYRNPVASFYSNPADVSELEPTVWFFDQSLNAIIGIGTSGKPITSVIHPMKKSIHTYTGGVNTYTVTLAVRTDYGCVDTIIKEIKVEPNIEFYVPNSFTPNNDGKNDKFYTVGLGIDESSFEMRILTAGTIVVFHFRYQ